MRALLGRVRRMEKTLLDPGTCPCGGRWRVRVWMDPDPEPEACGRCGTVGQIIHIFRAEYPEEDEQPPEPA